MGIGGTLTRPIILAGQDPKNKRFSRHLFGYFRLIHILGGLRVSQPCGIIKIIKIPKCEAAFRMKKIPLVLFAFCLVVGALGILGILDGPFLGLEYDFSARPIRISAVLPGSPAEKAGIPAGARIVKIGNRNIGPVDLMDDFDTIPDRKSFYSALATKHELGTILRPGTPIAIAYETTDGRRIETNILPADMPFGLAVARLARLYLPALFCLVIGLAVILKRPEDKRAIIFYLMLVCVSLIFLTFGSWTSCDTAMNPIIIFILIAINILFAFIYFPVFSFASAFPFPTT